MGEGGSFPTSHQNFQCCNFCLLSLILGSCRVEMSLPPPLLNLPIRSLNTEKPQTLPSSSQNWRKTHNSASPCICFSTQAPCRASTRSSLDLYVCNWDMLNHSAFKVQVLFFIFTCPVLFCYTWRWMKEKQQNIKIQLDICSSAVRVSTSDFSHYLYLF